GCWPDSAFSLVSLCVAVSEIADVRLLHPKRWLGQVDQGFIDISAVALNAAINGYSPYHSAPSSSSARASQPRLDFSKGGVTDRFGGCAALCFSQPLRLRYGSARKPWTARMTATTKAGAEPHTPGPRCGTPARLLPRKELP